MGYFLRARYPCNTLIVIKPVSHSSSLSRSPPPSRQKQRARAQLALEPLKRAAPLLRGTVQAAQPGRYQQNPVSASVGSSNNLKDHFPVSGVRNGSVSSALVLFIKPTSSPPELQISILNHEIDLE